MTERKTGAAKQVNVRRQRLGFLGERLAADQLEERGYLLLERNFRCVYGEIDLIAREAEDLVFIEVKTRRGNAYGFPEDAITPRKVRNFEWSSSSRWSFWDSYVSSIFLELDMITRNMYG